MTGVQTCALPISLGGPCAGTVAKLSGCNSGCHAGRGAGVWLAFGSAGCGPASPKRLGWLGRSGDRKSTRLNSSHGYISYAVFCLKKKKKKKNTDNIMQQKRI